MSYLPAEGDETEHPRRLHLQPWVLVHVDHRVLCPVCEEVLVFEALDRISDEELRHLLDEHVACEHEGG